MYIDGIEILCDADVKRAMQQMFHRAANSLKFSTAVLEKYEEHLDEDVNFFKKGNSAKGLVAGRIYIISLLTRQTRTQKEIAVQCETGRNLIRKYYRLMNGGFYVEPKFND